MKKEEDIIEKILRRNLIADFVEVYSLLIILLPLVIFFSIKYSFWVAIIVLSVFFSIFYLISKKDIQKIDFLDDEIKIKYLFKLKNKFSSIKYSLIKSIAYSSTPSGFSSITISYLDNNQQASFVMNGRGITRKNKTNFIEFFKKKNENIKFNGF